MSSTSAPAWSNELVERTALRIEMHLARLAAGRDPMGHLFAIERLARSARAEWWTAQRRHEPERGDL